jgi:CHASE2 domain-containing sensor protein
MDRLRRDGARLIGYDVQFIGPTDRRDDQALLARSGAPTRCWRPTTSTGRRL